MALLWGILIKAMEGWQYSSLLLFTGRLQSNTMIQSAIWKHVRQAVVCSHDQLWCVSCHDMYCACSKPGSTALGLHWHYPAHGRPGHTTHHLMRLTRIPPWWSYATVVTLLYFMNPMENGRKKQVYFDAKCFNICKYEGSSKIHGSMYCEDKKISNLFTSKRCF